MKLIPVLLCLLLTACTRAEGAISPPKLITEEIDLNQLQTSDKSLLPQVEPDSLEPVFNYVAGLNLALTGDISHLWPASLLPAPMKSLRVSWHKMH